MRAASIAIAGMLLLPGSRRSGHRRAEGGQPDDDEGRAGVLFGAETFDELRKVRKGGGV